MARSDDLYTLPADLPVPGDDGRAAHLPGTPVPSLALPETTGERRGLARIRGRAVGFAYA